MLILTGKKSIFSEYFGISDGIPVNCSDMGENDSENDKTDGETFFGFRACVSGGGYAAYVELPGYGSFPEKVFCPQRTSR